MPTEKWLTISYVEQWKGAGTSARRKLENLEPDVTHVRLFLCGIGVRPRIAAGVCRTLRKVKRRGVVVRCIGYHVQDALVKVFMQASPGERVLLRDTPLSVRLPVYCEHGEKHEPVLLAPLLRFGLREMLNGKEPFNRELLEALRVTGRRYERDLRALLPGISRKQARLLLENGYASPDVERIRNHPMERLMADLRASWEYAANPFTAVWVNEDAVAFGMADRVASWGDAFDDNFDPGTEG